MTHLKQAQEWLKARVVPDDKLPCEHVYEQVCAFARFQDKHTIGEHGAVGILTKTGLICAECKEAIPIEEKPKSLKEQGYTIEYDPVADRHSAVAPKPKECRKDMAFGTEDYIPCRLPIGHGGEHSDVPAPTPYTPTPVPEELKNIGCPCRCRGMDMCPHNERKICGCRNCTLESKLNELIRWARSLQPRNQ